MLQGVEGVRYLILFSEKKDTESKYKKARTNGGENGFRVLVTATSSTGLSRGEKKQKTQNKTD